MDPPNRRESVAVDQPLIGRAREREAIDAALRARGGGHLVLEGEPGIGKSRLLAYVAAAEGCTVLAARASEYEADLPYALWTEALDRHLAGWRAPLSRLGLADRRRCRRAAGAGRARAGAPTATAPTARCATCSSGSRRCARSSSASTTSTGPIPRRSTRSPRSCTARPPAPVLLALAARTGPAARALAAASP